MGWWGPGCQFRNAREMRGGNTVFERAVLYLEFQWMKSFPHLRPGGGASSPKLQHGGSGLLSVNPGVQRIVQGAQHLGVQNVL